MKQINDEEIKNDIWKTLKMWHPFNDLDEEQQTSLADYLFKTYGYLYREEKVTTGKS